MNKSLSLRMAPNPFLKDLISCTLMNSIPLKEVAEEAEASEAGSLQATPTKEVAASGVDEVATTTVL
jgi:hypothetical protein